MSLDLYTTLIASLSTYVFLSVVNDIDRFSSFEVSLIMKNLDYSIIQCILEGFSV